jgi:pimeloyl-ACP methyl ester carboxylesterase
LPGIEEKLLCGELTVFENRQTRVGRTIGLNVVVLPAFDQKTKAEPLFDLAGGPGAASTDAVTFYAKDGRDYRRRHDVVLVDQRGTGKSNGLKAKTREKRPKVFLTEMLSGELRKELAPNTEAARRSHAIHHLHCDG